MQYLDSLKKLASLKDKEIENKKRHANNEEVENKLSESIQVETDNSNLGKLLSDTSIGTELIFCEMGEIWETTERNEKQLIKELHQCRRKLPDLAAALLMKGVAIELMDGIGLSVPTNG